MNETEGTHILFLGLRHSGDKWSLISYPAEEQIEKDSGKIWFEELYLRGSDRCYLEAGRSRPILHPE